MHARNLPQPGHNLLEMLKVGDVEHDLHAGLAIFGTRSDVSYITLGISYYTCNAFKHTKTVVAINRELDRISRGRALIASPLHIDAAFRLVHQVGDVRTIHRVHRDSLAAGDVADNALPANRIAAARAVDQHISLAFDH